MEKHRNTSKAIYYFKGIRSKHLCKFIISDTKEFYSSITENLKKF